MATRVIFRKLWLRVTFFVGGHAWHVVDGHTWHLVKGCAHQLCSLMHDDDHWLSILTRFVTAGSWCSGCLPWMELGGLGLGLGLGLGMSARTSTKAVIPTR